MLFIFTIRTNNMCQLMVISLVMLVMLLAQSISLELCKETIPFINLTSYCPKNLTTQNCGCMNRTQCLRKCCKPGYYLYEKECYPFDNTSLSFKIKVYTDKTDFFSEVQFSSNFLVGLMKCDAFRLDPHQHMRTDSFFVQKDGQLWFPNAGRFYDNEKYCVDYSMDYNNSTSPPLYANVCFDPADQKILAHKINVAGMIISMPFLLATFLIYALLPERNLHMKALMFYVMSLLLGYIFLVIIQLGFNLGTVLCQMFGLFVVFFFIVSFFWMNVICLDIWFTFSGSRGFADGSKRSTNKKRLLIYSAYAWGMPILHVFIIFLIKNYGDEDSWYHPGMGEEQCFVKDLYPQFLYFYGPMGVLILANVILFVLTAIKIRQVKKETSMLKKDDSKRHNYESDKKKFNLYLKLLLAMGINWIMEIISWIVEVTFTKEQVPAYVWYFTDFCNASYGVFIFFLFVFKRKIGKQLKTRLVWMSKSKMPQTVITGSS